MRSTINDLLVNDDYTHILKNIFRFLSITDILGAQRVCHLWTNAHHTQ